MTEFNPDNKTELTYGEILGPAMNITELEDAVQYKAKYIEFIIGQADYVGEEGYTPEEVVDYNLKHYSGYYNHEISERVIRLFIEPYKSRIPMKIKI